MAKILTIEIDTAQIRVAEVDSRGQHIYRCFVLPVPQGAVDDGQIRDTKSLGNLLKEELIAQGIKTRKVFFVAGSSRIASRECTNYRLFLTPSATLAFSHKLFQLTFVHESCQSM